jgi:PAS domain S-box-containing protein
MNHTTPEHDLQLELDAAKARIAWLEEQLNRKSIADPAQEANLSASEIQNLYDLAPCGYHSLDASGRIVYINETELDWLGYTRDELLGTPIANLLTPASLQVFHKNFPVFLQRGWVKDLELEFRRKDGSTFPALVSGTAYRDADGNFVMSRSSVFDITERKQAEAAALASTGRLNFILEQTQAIIFTSGLKDDASMTFVSQSIRELLGYDPQELIENHVVWLSFVHPDDAGQWQLRLDDLKQTGQTTWQARVRHANGTYLWMTIGIRLVYDAQNHPLESVGYAVSIDQLMLAEMKLRASETQNRLLFEESPDALTLLDGDGKILKVNRAFKNLTDLSEEYLIGKSYPQIGLFSLNQVEYFEKLSQGLIDGANEEATTTEYVISRPDGSSSFVESRIYLVQLNERPHFLVATRDISPHKQVEARLQQANQELAKAARLKDEFLASMSHELRTPLTGILGLSESMQYKVYGPLNDRQVEIIGTIEKSGRHLLDLINDILDVSKLEAGKLDLQIDGCSFGQICQASLQLVKGMAQQKRQKISYAIQPEEILLKGDARRLKQIVVNLLSNAIKYTPDEGAIGLEVVGDPNAGCIEVCVWDKGIGIAPTDLVRLFQPFVQLDSSLSRAQTGTGLGLALVNRLVALHGGSLRVESNVGEGSRFTILLPWDTPQTPQKVLPVNGVTEKPPVSTLMVEDNLQDADQLARYLRLFGIDTVILAEGKSAVERALETCPGVIFLEINLPDISGWDILAALKANEQTRSIPVIVVSIEDFRATAQQNGADGCLHKPFTVAELQQELQKVLGQTVVERAAHLLAQEHPIPLVSIVDDNEINSRVLADFLISRKMHVITVRDGREFLERVGAIHPDIILMDIQMPGMDGLEVIQRLRNHPDALIAAVPIIAVTALAMPGDRERCIAAGADEYISKPLQLTKILELIKEKVG